MAAAFQIQVFVVGTNVTPDGSTLSSIAVCGVGKTGGHGHVRLITGYILLLDGSYSTTNLDSTPRHT